MKLVRLSIDRLPGIGEGFEVAELDPGLNLVIGPNASGKSSLCRAVRALLYRESVGGPVSLEAEFDLGVFDAGDDAAAPRRMRVIRQGRDVHWWRDGEAVEPPLLPDERLVSCFTIHVEDLLTSDETESVIRERIGRILAGGYDLDSARTKLGDLAGTGRSDAKRLKEAEAVLGNVRRAQAEIRESEQELADRRERKAESEAARDRRETVERAIALLDARHELSKSRALLEEHPEGMQALHGDELERIARLNEKREKSIEEGRGARDRRNDARGRKSASGFDANDAPNRSLLDEHRAMLEKLKGHERDIDDAEKAMARADAACTSTLDDLGGTKPPDEVRIDAAALRHSEELCAEKRKADTALCALDARLKLLAKAATETPGGGRPLDALREARAALSIWLASPPTPDTLDDRGGLYSIVGTSLLSAAGLVAIAVAAWKVHLLFLVLLPPLAAGALLLLRLREDVGPHSRRPEATLRVADSGISGPKHWNEEQVRTRLRELEVEIAVAERAENDALDSARLESERPDLLEKQRSIENALAALAQEIGFDAAALGDDFHLGLRRVKAYDDARAERNDARSDLTRSTGAADAPRGALRAFLVEHGEGALTEEAGAALLEVRLPAVDRRSEQHAGATKELAAAEKEIARASAVAGEAKREIDDLYRRAGLESGDSGGLEERLARLDRWKEHEKENSHRRTLANDAEARLGEEPDLLALVESADRDALEKRSRQEADCAALFEERSNRISDIEGSIARARKGNDLEEACAKRAAAQEELRAALETDLRAEAGVFLIDEVEREHEQSNRPPVLEKAAGWFARFTRHAFTLKPPRGRDTGFRARDEILEEDRWLEELSSGTRAQLLLALRLAFALDAEQGRESLPFFLDEALATTDPHRFREVVDAIGAFAGEEGRQVIYLTAQPADMAPWRNGVKPAPREIDMTELRGKQAGNGEAPTYPLEPLPEVPAPKGNDPEAYGEAIGALGLRLWEPASSVHLLHLLRDDLSMVHRLARMGVTRVGPLRALLSDPSSPLVKTEDRKRVAWRLDAIEILTTAMREGRGRPVDRDVLKDSDAVSDRYLDKLADLAGDLGGDAEGIIAAIRDKSDERVARFSASKCDALRAYFEREGHLDPREPLDPAELVQRLLAGVRHHVESGAVGEDEILCWYQDFAGAVGG